MRKTIFLIGLAAIIVPMIGCNEPPKEPVPLSNKWVSPVELNGLTVQEYWAVNSPDDYEPYYLLEVINRQAVRLSTESGIIHCSGFERCHAFDGADKSHYRDYAIPYAISHVVRTKEPVHDAVGKVSIATVQSLGMGLTITAGLPGEPHIPSVELGIKVLASSADGKTHVIRTDYFIPVDIRYPAWKTPEFTIRNRWGLPGGDELTMKVIPIVTEKESGDQVNVARLNATCVKDFGLVTRK